MATIPAEFQELFQKKAFAHLATVDEKCIPQVTPVWVDFDGEYVLVNSAKGRKKDRNIRANPWVALSIQDPDNPYRYLGIQGRVEAIVEEGAVEHIHALSRKYTGQDFGFLTEDQVRVIYKIRPERVWTNA